MVVIGLALLVTALQTDWVSGGLSLLGMDPRAARLAGSKLIVLESLVGAGLMFIGLSAWARAVRLRAAGGRYAVSLDRIAGPHGAHSVIVPGIGVGFKANIDGLQMEVVVEPEQNGQAFVRAACSARMDCRVWPRGMQDESLPLRRVASGGNWEAWAPGSESEPLSWSMVEGPLSRAFGPGGACEIRHDGGGIEVSMPNTPAEDLEGRLLVGMDAASAMARLNR